MQMRKNPEVKRFGCIPIIKPPGSMHAKFSAYHVERFGTRALRMWTNVIPRSIKVMQMREIPEVKRFVYLFTTNLWTSCMP